MDRKPRIFIGSSVESLPIADAINENLDHSAEVTIWRNGTFELSSTSIESLISKASSVDFSIFIFSPDDITVMRNNEKKTSRDNVVFELGLFIGKIGISRCFIVKPRGNELHLPSDLLGLTVADFEANRSDGDLASALNHACSQIKKSVKNQGTIDSIETINISNKTIYSGSLTINSIDFDILQYLLPTLTAYPDGFLVWDINNGLKFELIKTNLSLVKLERNGFVEKIIDSDSSGNNYYTYRLTQDGLDYLLKNEEKIYKKLANNGRIDDLPF